MREEITYRYGFEITQEEVISEWLFETNKKEKVLFLREKVKIDVKSSFKEGKIWKIKQGLMRFFCL